MALRASGASRFVCTERRRDPAARFPRLGKHGAQENTTQQFKPRSGAVQHRNRTATRNAQCGEQSSPGRPGTWVALIWPVAGGRHWRPVAGKQRRPEAGGQTSTRRRTDGRRRRTDARTPTVEPTSSFFKRAILLVFVTQSMPLCWGKSYAGFFVLGHYGAPYIHHKPRKNTRKSTKRAARARQQRLGGVGTREWFLSVGLGHTRCSSSSQVLIRNGVFGGYDRVQSKIHSRRESGIRIETWGGAGAGRGDWAANPGRRTFPLVTTACFSSETATVPTPLDA